MMDSPRARGLRSKGMLKPDELHTFEIVMKEGEGDDLTTLPEISPEKITEVLALRFKQNKIYTSIGNVLVAVNPYKTIPAGGDLVDIYDARVAYHYYNSSALEVAPHVYRVGAEAYKDLRTRGRSQSIIITGESGAGKTETAKVMMFLISTISQNVEAPMDMSQTMSSTLKEAHMDIDMIRKQLLESNPVLEAFGNSQTLRNDNSSRFGKYQQLLFDFKGDVVGGQVTQYLLEKSRVVGQAASERNFHVFYQLLAGASLEERKKNHLLDTAQGGYTYLMKKERRITGVDDAQAYHNLKTSMKIVGMQDEEIQEVMRLLSAILLLGNIDFDDHGSDERATVAPESQQTIQDVAHLLQKAEEEEKEKTDTILPMHIQVDAEALELALTIHNLPSTATKHSRELGRRVKDRMATLFNRDSLAKELYKRLFDFVVAKVNDSIRYEGDQKTRSIGLLDIYGFEIMHQNGFEQLCINFANERLQHIFIKQCCEAEQKEYEAEGLKWTHVDYFDNKVVVGAIEGKPNGVFEVLDMQCTFAKATADQLLASFNKAGENNPYFLSPQAMVKNKIEGSANMFGIRHYAGDVVYTVDGFIEKNRDTLTQDILTLMEGSQGRLAALLFKDTRSEQEKAKRPPTISTQFRRQVDELMASLQSCQPHYIRCIKPNDEKACDVVDMQRVTHQVKYLGIKENILVRRSGFCYRAKFADFISRYRLLCKESWEALHHPQQKNLTRAEAEEELVATVRGLLSNYTLKKSWGKAADKEEEEQQQLRFEEPTHYVIGRTMVFIKDPQTLHILEEKRARLFPAVAIKIQARFRGWRQRTRYLNAYAAACRLHAQARRFLYLTKFKRMKLAAIKVEAGVRFMRAKKYVKNLRKQFKNQAPRLWARQIQRVFRGHRSRNGLDQTTYEKSHRLGLRLLEIMKEIRASSKVGAWYRAHVASKKYNKTRANLIKIQAVARLYGARRRRKNREAEELKETKQALMKGIQLIKYFGQGAKAHNRVVQLSPSGDRLRWTPYSLFGAGKEGIKLTEVKKIEKGVGSHHKAVGGDHKAKCFTIDGVKRDYTFEAESEHKRDQICRFLQSVASSSSKDNVRGA